MKVYLDYAATSPIRKEVLEAMLPYLKTSFGNASSIHNWGQKNRKAIEDSRRQAAIILNCQPDEIYFTGTTTISANIAIMGLARQNKKKGTHLITTPVEHKAVLGTFYHLHDQEDFKMDLMQVDQYGLVDPEELEKLIKPETILISVMYANNEVGTVQPIEEIGKRLKKINQERNKKGYPRIYFHVDGATVAEYFDLDLAKLKVDLFSLGAHKFHGPKGSGILFVKKGTPLQPIIYGGHHEKGLWPGTENVAGIVGTVKALEIAQKETQKSAQKVIRLRDKLIKSLLKIPKAKLTGHPQKRLPDIASFTFEGAEGEAILLMLDKKGIAASSGSACTSGELKASHVLLAMGIPDEIAHSSIRFSLGKETTEKEIDYVIKVVPEIIKELRKRSPYGSDVSPKSQHL